MNELEIRKEVDSLQASAEAVKITDALSKQNALEFTRAIKDKIEVVKDHYAPFKKKSYAAWKAVVASETEMLKPLEIAEKIIKSELSRYLTLQEEIANKERARLENIEAAKAAKERARLIKKGLEDEADLVFVKPVVVEQEKTAGVIEKTEITVEITSVKEVCQAVIAGVLPPVIIEINQNKLKSFIKSMCLTSVPGLNIGSQKSVAIRR